jgi:hypothetical protein
MSAVDYLEDEMVPIGLTRDEVRLVARRQLIASIAAAIVIVAGAALLIPAMHGVRMAERDGARVHQPSFASLPYQGAVSSKPSEIELP